MILEGGSTKIAVGLVGLSSIALGLAEAASAAPVASLAPLNITAGGTLLIALWVGQRVARVAERFFEEQGTKLIALPTAEMLEKDKATLFEKLEAFAHDSAAERKETAAFRREFAATLADHGARLKSLEERRS